MNLHITPQEFLKEYLIEALLPHDTREQYRIVCDLVQRWRPGLDALGLFDRTVLFEFRNWLAQTRAETTVNHKVAIVVALWNYACDRGWLEMPPPRSKRLKLKPPKRAPDAWTPQQFFGQILPATKHAHQTAGWSREHWDCTLLTLWHSAARIKGLVGDCDVSAPREFWDRPGCSVSDLAGTRLVLPYSSDKTKTDQVHPVPPELAQRLLSLSRIDQRLLAWPRTLDTLRAHYRVILHFAGLPASRRDLLHKVRGTKATDVAREEGLKAASRKLGHGGEAVTRGHYVDPSAM